MDLQDMTVREIQAALKDGTLTEEDLASLPGALGKGAQMVVNLSRSHESFPDREEFITNLASALQNPASGRPPEKGKTARLLGCDEKTMMRYLLKYLHLKTWHALLARLLESGIGAIVEMQHKPKDPPRMD